MEQANQKSGGKCRKAGNSANSVAKTPRRRGFLIGLLIFFLALLVRLIYLYESSANPSFEVPLVDAASYDKIARAFADGKGMDYNFFWQPFFYQFFLSLVYVISGSSIVCAKVIQAFLGALTCVLACRLGEKIFNRGLGVIAGIILAFYGPLVFFESELLATGWAAFWLVLITLLFLEAAQKKNVWYWFALGVCGGLSIITRPTFVPLFLAGCVWLCLRLRNNPSLLGRASATVFLGILMVMVPVGLTGRHITGRFKVLPTSGGLNLYIGNNPDYCKTLTTRPGDDWMELIDLPSRYGVPIEKHDQFFKNLVKEYAKSQPIGFVRGLSRKAIECVNSREIPRNVDIYVFTGWSRLLGLLVWKVGRFGFPFGVVFPLAVLGLAYRQREIPPPMILALIFYPLSIILVFISGRYRAPLIPILAILAAAGLVSVGRMVRLKQWKNLGVMGTLAGAMVLLSSLPGPFCEEQLDYEAEFYLYLGLTRRMNEQDSADELIGYYEKALQLKPDYPEAHNSLATVLMDQENYTQAVAHLREALRLRPDYHKGYNNLGLVLMQQGKLDEAVKQYDKALRLKPDYPEAQNNLAIALARQGKLDEAIVRFEKAIRLKPGFPVAHNSLGVVLMRQGRLAEAIRHYLETLRLKSDYPEAHYNLGLALVRQDKLTKAVEHFEQALHFNSDFPEAHYELGMALARLGQTGPAIKHLKEALRLKPDYSDAYYHLASIFAQQNKLNDAAENYKKALALRPDHPETHNSLGVILTRLGQTTEAIEHYKEALRLRTNYPKAHRNLGSALMQKGELPQAIQHLEEALRLDESLIGVKQQLAMAHGKYGSILAKQSKFKQAVAHWIKAIQLNDRLAVVHNNLGWTLAVYKDASFYDPNQALVHAQKACQLTNNSSPDLLDTLAVAYAATGRFTQAVETADKALELALSAKQYELADKIKQHLELYQSQQPYYEPLSY